MEALVHLRPAPEQPWEHLDRTFVTQPRTGEYLAMDTISDWYLIDLVVHTPEDDQYDFEIFATLEQFTLTKEKLQDTR